MEQTGAALPPPSAADFAGILAALTRPAAQQEPAWNEDIPADDVATLTYENALRADAHRQSESESASWTREQAVSTPGSEREEIWDEPEPEPAVKSLPRAEAQSQARAGSPALSPEPPQQSRKCASITVRMSRSECEQLRRRAAEAGMTISAYLRSCTFEAESLRAQVKQALAEMKQARTAAVSPAPVSPAAVVRQPERAQRPGWLRRLVPGLPMPPRAA